MSEKGNGKLPRIGVYICHCGLNIANVVDVEAVAEFAGKLPGVVLSKAYKYMCSDPGLEMIKAEIKEHNLDRVVVASCSPLLHEHTFRHAIEEGGILNPYLYTHVNIREHVSWVHAAEPAKATEKAKALVAAAVRRVSAHKPLERKRVNVNPDVLVLGGGIAGIHASLVMADSGKKVYLVEREPSIGGHMAKFDKTFPTLDCAACILTPKMAQAGSHPNIKLLTYSELKGIEGYVGNFKATILKKSRRIIEEKCTSCGECAKVCPVEIPSGFDENLSKRKATYRPFPQAVPNIYLIERLGYPPCEAACPIHQNAYGYIALVAAGKFREALDVILRDNPLPSVCGRVCTHPCTDACTRGKKDDPLHIPGIKRFVVDYAGDYTLPMPKDWVERKESIGIVGSGPAGLTAAYELRKRGYKVTIYEKLPVAGGMMRTGIPDFRLPKDVLDKEIKRILDTGIELKLNTALGKDITLEALKNNHEAVFLAIGAYKEKKLGVEGEDTGGVWGGVDFLMKINMGEKPSVGQNVVVIGGGNSAIDAARTALRLGANKVTIVYRRTINEMPADPAEVQAAMAEGVEIRFLEAPKRFISDGGKVKAIEALSMELGEPDESGRRRPVIKEGTEHLIPCDTVIVTIGQEPELPEGLGLKLTKWNTFDVDPVTLATSDPKVFAGGDCVTGPDVIITAMMAGKKAAESIHRQINGLDMLEGRELEGPFQGVTREIDLDGIPYVRRAEFPELDPKSRAKTWEEVHTGYTAEKAQEEAARCLSCSICCDCQLCKPVCPAECIDYTIPDKEMQIPVGAILVSTGFKVFNAKRIPTYGYGRLPNVYTSLEIERLVNSAGPTEGKIVLRDGKTTPKAVGIVHCVGSRDKDYNEYCSRVCCMYSLKLAHLIKERTGAEVYNFYIDMRTPGKGYEEFYHRLLDEGVHFIRGRVAEVSDWATEPGEEGKLIIRAEDTAAGVVRRVPVDMVVLSVGLEPQPDAQDIRRLLNLSCSSEGFFLERHPKLAPVSTFTAGIYLAGACQGPKDIPDSVAQAGAAASEIMSLSDKGYIELEPIKAHINAEDCSGCKMCNGLCPYDAITYDKEKKVSEINEVLCEGCGTCVAACPSGAIDQDLFENEELLYEIEGVLRYV